jgi:hypothetical protein
MTVTGPYHTDRPRFAGEHWKVTVRKGSAILTRGFHSIDEAHAFVATLKENN